MYKKKSRRPSVIHESKVWELLASGVAFQPLPGCHTPKLGPPGVQCPAAPFSSGACVPGVHRDTPDVTGGSGLCYSGAADLGHGAFRRLSFLVYKKGVITTSPERGKNLKCNKLLHLSMTRNKFLQYQKKYKRLRELSQTGHLPPPAPACSQDGPVIMLVLFSLKSRLGRSAVLSGVHRCPEGPEQADVSLPKEPGLPSSFGTWPWPLARSRHDPT